MWNSSWETRPGICPSSFSFSSSFSARRLHRAPWAPSCPGTRPCPAHHGRAARMTKAERLQRVSHRILYLKRGCAKLKCLVHGGEIRPRPSNEKTIGNTITCQSRSHINLNHCSVIYNNAHSFLKTNEMWSRGNRLPSVATQKQTRPQRSVTNFWWSVKAAIPESRRPRTILKN